MLAEPPVEDMTGAPLAEVAAGTATAGPAQPDPLLLWHVDATAVLGAWRCGRAAGVRTTRGGRPYLLVTGEPGSAAALTAAVLAEHRVERVTLPAGTVPHLVARWPGTAERLHGGDDWEFFWTRSAPTPEVPGEDRAQVLDVGAPETDLAGTGAAGAGGTGDARDLDALLDAANPRSSARPGDGHVRLWMGIRERQLLGRAGPGDLVACVASTVEGNGVVPHLAAVATHPSARGRGYGSAVTAAVTRRLLEHGEDVVTLGMYSDNDVARRMYTRLGWTMSNACSSRLVRSRHQPPSDAD